jgi:Arginine deiminase
MLEINVGSEIGNLNGVILHTPGKEIEMMTPHTFKDCLYSDLLNLKIAQKEYSFFEAVLSKYTKTFQVEDLLCEILKNKEVKQSLVSEVLAFENKKNLKENLVTMDCKELAKIMIEGKEELMAPLYNFYFTRDASSSMYNAVVIHPMQFRVRERESIIMRNIFTHYFSAPIFLPNSFDPKATTEGGDLLIAREDTIFLGQGMRSNNKGLEFLIDYFAQRKKKFNILTQELPHEPDSFIHLDMVFTFLDKGYCMTYEPLIVKNEDNREVSLVTIDNGKVSISHPKTFMEGTKALGFDLKPLSCGGVNNLYQQREQWHSGANFFAMGEGKIIGYARNTNTIDTLNNNGFSVLKASDVVSGAVDMKNYERFVVTFEAAELPRGAGGARCMTMPINRDKVIW